MVVALVFRVAALVDASSSLATAIEVHLSSLVHGDSSLTRNLLFDFKHGEIRPSIAPNRRRIPSVSGLSTDLPSFARPKQRAQTEREYWMIVSHQNAKRTHRTP